MLSTYSKVMEIKWKLQTRNGLKMTRNLHVLSITKCINSQMLMIKKKKCTTLKKVVFKKTDECILLDIIKINPLPHIWFVVVLLWERIWNLLCHLHLLEIKGSYKMQFWYLVKNIQLCSTNMKGWLNKAKEYRNSHPWSQLA